MDKKNWYMILKKILIQNTKNNSGKCLIQKNKTKMILKTILIQNTKKINKNKTLIQKWLIHSKYWEQITAEACGIRRVIVLEKQQRHLYDLHSSLTFQWKWKMSNFISWLCRTRGTSPKHDRLIQLTDKHSMTPWEYHDTWTESLKKRRGRFSVSRQRK